MNERARDSSTPVADLLLTRSGLVFVRPADAAPSAQALRGLELELANIGYVCSSRLSERLSHLSDAALSALRDDLRRALLAHVGGAQAHEVLFRRFPEGIPADTEALWWQKVLVHFLQAEGQPCIFCGRSGTTHVLNPCRHVVCDQCFDGSSYSACPSCEHHVDRSSPFFREAPVRDMPSERVRFKRLDLGDDLDEAARRLFLSLCERKQALSPTDREALMTIVRAHGEQLPAWLPRAIPVRENVAVIFGTLCGVLDPGRVMAHARSYMTTATDVLRFLAVLSGTDGSLQREAVAQAVRVADVGSGRFWGSVARLLGLAVTPRPEVTATVTVRVNRFKMAKLPRPLRRALLGLLEGLDADRLIEDMLRHRSYWVWAGEFLHPHEYASRYPKVASAFLVVRGKAPDGTKAPRFRGYYSRVQQATDARDISSLVKILSERPGEFARRFDHALRLAGEAGIEDVLMAFASLVSAFATPVLLTLKAHLPTRAQRVARRVYWPKGKIGMGVSAPDERAPLSAAAIEQAVHVIDEELLKRFAARPGFTECVIDERLRGVIVPFNERTASPSAVSLTRGTHIPLPETKVLRLFLHWCQPQEGGHATDLDLSVGFYGDDWTYRGVCSYYELQFEAANGDDIAQSAGDLRDAPWPDGASEMVDLHWQRALDSQIRYAVMVVNAYAGMSFAQLERAFAGVMMRDDLGGWQFDPRTVELRFNLQGDHGIFMPLVADLRDGVIHWLDVYAKGQLALNNVASSSKDIQKICPELITYFASGARLSMYDLGLLHAAARCQRVTVRGAETRAFVRRPDEGAEAFHARLVRGEADGPSSETFVEPVLALLFRGDLDLPPESSTYALFRERVIPTLAASDLLG